MKNILDRSRTTTQALEMKFEDEVMELLIPKDTMALKNCAESQSRKVGRFE